MNLTLTRKLAVLQATGANLRETSRSFTDTADMFAYRQFQMELAEYLGTHRATGDIPQEPDAFVRGEIDRLEQVLQPVAGFVQEQLALGRDILAAKKQSLTQAQVSECQAAADAAFSSLVEQQHRLAAGFLNKDLSVEADGVDIAPDLIAFCKLARTQSPLLQPERAARCQFANGDGPLHAEVVEHLEAVRAGCAALLELHGEQAETQAGPRACGDGRFLSCGGADRRVEPRLHRPALPARNRDRGRLAQKLGRGGAEI